MFLWLQDVNTRFLPTFYFIVSEARRVLKGSWLLMKQKLCVACIMMWRDCVKMVLIPLKGQTSVMQSCPCCRAFWVFGSAVTEAVGRCGQTCVRDSAKQCGTESGRRRVFLNRPTNLVLVRCTSTVKKGSVHIQEQNFKHLSTLTAGSKNAQWNRKELLRIRCLNCFLAFVYLSISAVGVITCPSAQCCEDE